MDSSSASGARDRLHSVASAADFLGGVAESSIRVRLWRGTLTRVKVGRRTMIRESELLALIKPESGHKGAAMKGKP